MNAALKQYPLNWILGASLWRQRGRGIQDGPLQVRNALAKGNLDKKVKILAGLGIRWKNKIIFLQVRRALQLPSERHPGWLFQIGQRTEISQMCMHFMFVKASTKRGNKVLVSSIDCWSSRSICQIVHICDLSPVNLSTKGPEFLNKTLRSYQFWQTDTDLFMQVSSSNKSF